MVAHAVRRPLMWTDWQFTSGVMAGVIDELNLHYSEVPCLTVNVYNDDIQQ